MQGGGEERGGDAAVAAWCALLNFFVPWRNASQSSNDSTSFRLV